MLYSVVSFNVTTASFDCDATTNEKPVTLAEECLLFSKHVVHKPKKIYNNITFTIPKTTFVH